MEEKLHTLYQIQQKDTAIDTIHLQRGELPLEVQDLEAEVEGIKASIEDLNAEIADIEKRQGQYRASIEEARNLIENYTNVFQYR